MLHIQPVKAFNDNYLWVFHAEGSRDACVVDPGASAPVLDYLESEGLELAAILITHHHADHIGGIDALLQRHQVPVYGPATPRIPQVTVPVVEGQTVSVCGHDFRVLEIPGHTLEHIAYMSTSRAAASGPVLFCGDTLFAAGCGRMFEGTPPMMHASLQKLAALPAETLVFCAHEYTLSNLRFARAVMPDDPAVSARIDDETAKRNRDLPTLPSSIGVELRTNPFLRCTDARVVDAALAHAPGAARDPASIFGALRRWKDSF